MKKIITYLVLAIVAVGCGVTKPATEKERIEVRYVTETVHDTAFVDMPVIVERTETLDTASMLECKYARSEAAVSGGVLRHSLQTLPAKLPVVVDTKIVYRDSIITQDSIIRIPVEVERPLTFWQRIKIKIGGIAIALILLYGLYVSLKTYLNH